METFELFNKLNDILHRLHSGEQIDNAELLQFLSDLVPAYCDTITEVQELRKEIRSCCQ